MMLNQSNILPVILSLLFSLFHCTENLFSKANTDNSHQLKFVIFPASFYATQQTWDIRMGEWKYKGETNAIWGANVGYFACEIPIKSTSDFSLQQLELKLEIGSEATGTNDDYPSDIEFLVNGIICDRWTSPGDPGKGGILSKQHEFGNQEWGSREDHGYLHMFIVPESKLMCVSSTARNQERMILTLQVAQDTEHQGHDMGR